MDKCTSAQGQQGSQSKGNRGLCVLHKTRFTGGVLQHAWYRLLDRRASNHGKEKEEQCRRVYEDRPSSRELWVAGTFTILLSVLFFRGNKFCLSCHFSATVTPLVKPLPHTHTHTPSITCPLCGSPCLFFFLPILTWKLRTRRNSWCIYIFAYISWDQESQIVLNLDSGSISASLVKFNYYLRLLIRYICKVNIPKFSRSTEIHILYTFSFSFGQLKRHKTTIPWLS